MKSKEVIRPLKKLRGSLNFIHQISIPNKLEIQNLDFNDGISFYRRDFDFAKRDWCIEMVQRRSSRLKTSITSNWGKIRRRFFLVCLFIIYEVLKASWIFCWNSFWQLVSKTSGDRKRSFRRSFFTLNKDIYILWIQIIIRIIRLTRKQFPVVFFVFHGFKTFCRRFFDEFLL